MPCKKKKYKFGFVNMEGILYRFKDKNGNIKIYDLYKNSHLLHSVPVEIEVRIGSQYCLMVVLKGE